MPDKRFLGLGFTFAATDKGLEKKLTSVSSILDDISQSLDDINEGAARASSSLGRMKSPSKSSSSTRTASKRKLTSSGSGDDSMGKLLDFLKKNMKQAHGTRPSGYLRKAIASKAALPKAQARPPIEQDLVYGTFDDLREKFSDNAKKLIEDLGKTVDADIYKSFIKHMGDVGISLRKTGDFSESAEKKIAQNLATMIKASTEAKSMTKSFEGLKVAMHAVKEWAVDVKNSFLAFLTELGIDFNKMIPKEIKAFGGLLKSLLTGPLNLMKSIGGKFFKNKDQKKAEKLQKDISTAIGKGTRNENVVKLLKNILEVGEEKAGDKGGWLKKLLGAPLAFLEGLLSALFSPLKLLSGLLGFVTKGFSLLWDGLKFVGEFVFDTLGGAFTSLWESISGFIEEIGGNFVVGAIEELFAGVAEVFGVFEAPLVAAGAAVIAALVAVGAIFTGFIKQIVDDFSQWKDLFVRLGSAIWKITQNFIDASPALSGLIDAVKFVADGIVSIVKSIGGVIQNFVSYIWDKITGLFSFGKGLGSSALSAFGNLVSGAESIANQTSPSAQPTTDLDQKAYSDKTIGLQSSMLDVHTKNLDLMKEQKERQEDTNNLLQKMLDHFNGQDNKSQNPGPSVNLSFDARKWGMSYDQNSLNEAAAGGM